MVFSSSLFLVYFLPIFLASYHLVSKSLKNYVILIASIFFYAWGAPDFLFIMLGTTILNFFCVQQMHKTEKTNLKKILLGVSVIMNLGMLAYYKYANFFVENVNTLLGIAELDAVPWLKVVLPVGISFYTFQTLTYSVDVYRKVHNPLDKLSDYVLYIMSFPQMIAGPIVRFTSIADEIINRKENIDDKLWGVYRFVLGLSKKVLIANVMAEQADLIFNGNLTEITTIQAWIGILAYTFQIYFDFSGYSDMAIGLGKILGFTFPDNFNSPYTAKSITEFWRRWHMTLGRFMRDYLYIPLGGNRVDSKARLFFNLWIVFLLSGLWHGASWNFVIWGAYHGLFLILDRLFLQKLLDKVGAVLSTIITFWLVMMGWVIFRLEEMDKLIIYFSKLYSFENIGEYTTIPAFNFTCVFAVLFAFIASFSWGQKIENFLFEKGKYTLKQHLVFVTISIVLMTLCLSFVVSSDFNPFIYFRF